MNLGVILPCTLLYGGVKRFLELGNIFITKGHSFTVFTPQGEQPNWIDFKGDVKLLDDIKQVELDAIFFTEYRYLPYIKESKAKRKIFYHVLNDKQIAKIAKEREIETMACSTNICEFDKKYGLKSFPAIGGVNIANYHPKESYKKEEGEPIYIMAYGRLGMRTKGTMFVVRACEQLYKRGVNIKLLLYDTPVNEKGRRRIEEFKAKVPYEFILNHPFNKNSELFNKADIFVAAEGNAGWANTVAEAMSCAVPVVATVAGTKDLVIDGVTGLRCIRWSFSIRRQLKKLISDEALREQLGRAGRKQVEQFDWHNLADKIEIYLK